VVGRREKKGEDDKSDVKNSLLQNFYNPAVFTNNSGKVPGHSDSSVCSKGGELLRKLSVDCIQYCIHQATIQAAMGEREAPNLWLLTR
jgi:hypothetical protein